MKILSDISITPGSVVLKGEKISTADISGLYREFIGDYPKFFKMDSLCKLGFIGAELLLKGMDAQDKENAAIVMFNRNGSLVTDRNYQKTITEDNYFPSPALFVYTLSNIVTGEIAIRNRIYGESSFYVLENKDADMMDDMVENTFLTSSPTFILTGWVDYNNEQDYEAELKIVTK